MLGAGRAAIEKLREQNEQLKGELLLENKFSVRPGDPFAQALINRLQDEGDMLARKVGKLHVHDNASMLIHCNHFIIPIGISRLCLRCAKPRCWSST